MPEPAAETVPWRIHSRRPETGHTLDIVPVTVAGTGEQYLLVKIEAPWNTVAIEVDIEPVLAAIGPTPATSGDVIQRAVLVINQRAPYDADPIARDLASAGLLVDGHDQARTAKALALVDELLRHFTQHGHPGEPSVRTGWIKTRTVEEWCKRRAALTEESDRG